MGSRPWLPCGLGYPNEQYFLCTLRCAFRWVAIHTPRFTFWGLSPELLVKHREFFQFKFFRGLSWCISFWLIDFSGWLVYWLFQQCEHLGYWGIFLFLSSVVRPLAFLVYDFKPICFLFTFELVFISFPLRAQSSRTRVVFHLWPRVISFPFRARSFWPRVVFHLWPRVISFSFRAQSSRHKVNFHLWPRVISFSFRA